MANSKYEYVRGFERDETLLPNTWIVVRIDGRGFHKLSHYYGFSKPNDPRALHLMNYAATHVVSSIPEIVLAYGVSDEYSFVFHRGTTLFERRKEKIVSTVVSAFTAAYVLGWDRFFGRDAQQGGQQGGDMAEEEKEDESVPAGDGKLSMEMLPTFDGRAVCYPSWGNLRDYLSWRQVDCHINNLYNTTFWALVQKGGMTPTAAEEFLKGTVSGDKNEILWSRFGINYNNEPDMYKKGSVVFREYMLEEVEEQEEDVRRKDKGKGKGGEQDSDARKLATEQDRGQGHDREREREQKQEDDEGSSGVPEPVLSKTQAEKMRKARNKAKVVTKHVDIIRDDFWIPRPWLRSGKPGRPTGGRKEDGTTRHG